MYKLLRSILFKFDPEKVHYFSMHSLQLLCKIPFGKNILRSCFATAATYSNPFSIWGISFKNRVGLGAGFDKNAEYLTELEALGFGFVEIGTVTPKAQSGNDKPRAFRLPKDKVLINRMGFNNVGVEAIAKRLQQWRANHQPQTPNHKLIIGGNIGKNKLTPNQDAWKDYEICFMELHDHVDYFVVNVSSPNTPGLRELQEKDALGLILKNLQRINKEKATPKPILLKIAPDLTYPQIDDVISLAMEIQLDGLVATNTTVLREVSNSTKEEVEKIGAGGLSGLPLKNKSTEIVKYICEKTQGKIPVIASGGIFTGSDAREKIDAGASLVQVWTGFIYEGPAIVKNICKELA
ncbi:MAG: quinone-dependent dihydroorotate dehydrogenase [Ferruginibacter sp.]